MPRKKKRVLAKNRDNGPYLAMAVLCENVLEDKDGVLSIIRIVDSFRLQVRSISGEVVPPAAKQYLTLPISFQIVISLKAGRARGSRNLRIIPKTPAGLVISDTVFHISLNTPKEPGGVNLRIPMQLPVKEEGIYWIDVFLNEEPLTRIFLRVEFEEVKGAGMRS